MPFYDQYDNSNPFIAKVLKIGSFSTYINEKKSVWPMHLFLEHGTSDMLTNMHVHSPL
jgi:hypothetical protein